MEVSKKSISQRRGLERWVPTVPRLQGALVSISRKFQSPSAVGITRATGLDPYWKTECGDSQYMNSTAKQDNRLICQSVNKAQRELMWPGSASCSATACMLHHNTPAAYWLLNVWAALSSLRCSALLRLQFGLSHFSSNSYVPFSSSPLPLHLGTFFLSLVLSPVHAPPALSLLLPAQVCCLNISPVTCWLVCSWSAELHKCNFVISQSQAGSNTKHHTYHI